MQAVTYCFSDTIGVTGFLVPREEAIVNLDADGYRISEALVKEGATVTSGQELVRLTRLSVEGQNVPAPPGARPGPATMVLKAPAAGLVTRHHFEGGHAVFELERGHHHDHMVCIKCGHVDEFEERFHAH